MSLQCNAHLQSKGGDEAAIFAGELCQMYCNYAAFREWEVQTQGVEKTETGGIRQAAFLISGEGVFRWLKFEGGVHRVQRVPATDKNKRIHTSTASIAVMPVPQEITIQIPKKDLEVQICKASGPGGMNINANPTAVRIVHLPTKIAIESQVHRTALKNEEYAMKRLRYALYERQFAKQQRNIESGRKLQVGHGERHEKIRTYNFPNVRVTDHRIKQSWHTLRQILDGGEHLHTIMCAMRDYDKWQRLNEVLDTVDVS